MGHANWKDSGLCLTRKGTPFPFLRKPSPIRRGGEKTSLLFTRRDSLGKAPVMTGPPHPQDYTIFFVTYFPCEFTLLFIFTSLKSLTPFCTSPAITDSQVSSYSRQSIKPSELCSSYHMRTYMLSTGAPKSLPQAKQPSCTSRKLPQR